MYLFFVVNQKWKEAENVYQKFVKEIISSVNQIKRNSSKPVPRLVSKLSSDPSAYDDMSNLLLKCLTKKTFTPFPISAPIQDWLSTV